jgi:C-terminal processing protease CtpA/Prc
VRGLLNVRTASTAILLVGTAMTLLVACSSWTGSVGAVFGKTSADGRVWVREAPPGMGAAKAGIEVGDELIAIEGKPAQTMTPAEIHDALSGRVGTKVKVMVKRAATTVELAVERGPLAGE